MENQYKENPIGLKGSHLAWLVVKDLSQAIPFYVESLGLTLKEYSPEFGWAELAGPDGLRIGLAAEQEKASPVDGTHVKSGSNAVITLTVENLDKAKDAYLKKGVKLLGAVLEVEWHVKMQTFQDLDGNLFQLVEML